MFRSPWMVLGIPMGMTATIFLGAAAGNVELGALIGLPVGAAVGWGMKKAVASQSEDGATPQ